MNLKFCITSGSADVTDVGIQGRKLTEFWSLSRVQSISWPRFSLAVLKYKQPIVIVKSYLIKTTWLQIRCSLSPMQQISSQFSLLTKLLTMNPSQKFPPDRILSSLRPSRRPAESTLSTPGTRPHNFRDAKRQLGSLNSSPCEVNSFWTMADIYVHNRK